MNNTHHLTKKQHKQSITTPILLFSCGWILISKYTVPTNQLYYLQKHHRNLRHRAVYQPTNHPSFAARAFYEGFKQLDRHGITHMT